MRLDTLNPLHFHYTGPFQTPSVRPFLSGLGPQAEAVPAADAPGRVSAETICPYPPGVPVLAPGEVVTSQLVDGLATGGCGVTSRLARGLIEPWSGVQLFRQAAGRSRRRMILPCPSPGILIEAEVPSGKGDGWWLEALADCAAF